MDTDHNTSYTRDTHLNHHNPNSINHPKRKKWYTSYPEAELQRKLQKSNFWICPSIFRERVRTLSGNSEKVLRNWYGANTYIFVEAPNNSSWTNTECQLVIPDNYWLLHILKFPYSNDCFLIPFSMVYGASPETTPRNTQRLIPETIRNTYKLCFVTWGYSLAPNVPMKNLK